MATDALDTVKNWVDNNQDWFERAVLWCVTFEPATAARIASVVCRGSTGAQIQDFSSPLYNSYYRIIRDFKATAVGGEVTEQVAAMLAHSAPASELGAHEVAQFLELYRQLRDTPLQSLVACVNNGVNYWLGKRRMALTVASSVSFRDWDAGLVVGNLNAEMNFIDTALNPDGHVFELSQLIMQQRPRVVDCIPTGIVAYDRQLGGGFHRGEGVLGIAAPGVGKTVFALQMGVQAALAGYKVVFITTEQGPEELVPRIISNFCKVPFRKIMRGFTLSILDPEERKRADRFMIDVFKRFQFVDWSSGQRTVAGGGLENEIKTCQDKLGGCDFMILDWIGGALTAEARNDKDKKRLAMQNAADATAQLAKDHDMATLAMAQAHKKDGINNVCVSVSDCTDCKTLDQKMTVVTGITGMFNSNAKSAIAEGKDPAAMGLFEDKQFLFTSKARKSSGGHAPFRRSFGYQKIEDWD